MTLSFDIETVENDLDEEFRDLVVENDDAKAKAFASDDGRVLTEARVDPLTRLALSPFTGRVVVISCWDDVQRKGLCLTNDALAAATLPEGFALKAHADERTLLETWWNICSRQKRFASFNGLTFDQPFLVARSLVNDVCVHTPLLRAKPWEDVHVDLCDKLAPKGSTKAPFDFVCRALGVPTPKAEITGADVSKYWRDPARRELVAAYCCRDTRALALCLEKWDRCAMGMTEPRNPEMR